MMRGSLRSQISDGAYIMQTMAVVGAQRPLPGTSQRRHICRRRPGSEFRLQTVRRRYWQCNGAARCTSNHRRCALPPDRAAPGWPEFSRPRSRPALAKQPDRCRTPGTSRQTHHPLTRHGVHGTNISAQAIGDFDQQEVTGCMAMRVVKKLADAYLAVWCDQGVLPAVTP